MLPSPIVSSGSILALWFTTDFAVSAQGFKAVYEGKMTCSGVAGPSEQITLTSDVPENRKILPVETYEALKATSFSVSDLWFLGLLLLL